MFLYSNHVVTKMKKMTDSQMLLKGKQLFKDG